MDEMLFSFNEDGELVKAPEYSVEIDFETEDEMEKFQDFIRCGEMEKAFAKWEEQKK